MIPCRRTASPRLALTLNVLAVVLLTLPLAAGTARAADEAKKPDGKLKPPVLEDQSKTTKHQVVIDGKTIHFEATAGTWVMRDEAGNAKATIFAISYVREGTKDPATRPVTFSFNGGPGSSSVWLHLGLLGPWRTRLEADGSAPPPPYELVENPHSLLDATDLVFIDPVMTGYSRPAPEEDPKQFHGLEQDVESVGEFIRLWTTRNERWASPKYLIGESYGTTRAASLAGWLQERHGFYLNGVMLISSILEFQTARFDVGNDLPYILFLPTFTATAWQHGRLAPDLQASLDEALAEAETFALGEYSTALLLGDRLSDEARTRVGARLARLTGLSPDYIARAGLRVGIHRFTKELLRDQGLTVGRLDSRFTGRDRDSVGETPDYDPSYAAIQGPYTATLNDLVRRRLKFESDLPYEILTGRVHPWSYAKQENRYVNVAETLRAAMTRNPRLRVFVANGRHDLATPYFATMHTFAHLGLPPELRSNVSMGFYPAGHMMYVHEPSLAALDADLKAFVTASPAP